jgi:hypothetical protein
MPRSIQGQRFNPLNNMLDPVSRCLYVESAQRIAVKSVLMFGFVLIF